MADDGFDNLGFTSVAIIYSMFASSAFFGGAIVNKINNARITMALGSLCYSGWIFCFLLPTYYNEWRGGSKMPWYLNRTFIKVAVKISSALLGLGGGILWVAQGDFISACSCEENKGFFSGLFWWFEIS